MQDKQKKPIQAALLGMDGRSFKTMAMFLQGPCEGAAVLVDERVAEIDIIDADVVNSKHILAKCLEREPKRPVIVLSLQTINVRADDNVICLKKPIETDAMLDALRKARDIIAGKVNIRPEFSRPENALELRADKDAASGKFVERSYLKTALAPVSPPAAAEEEPKIVDFEEQKKTAKHNSTLQFDEKGFTAFIGSIPGLDVNDPDQRLLASYNPKDYYQGYVQSALNMAMTQKRVLILNSGWKPLTVLPHSREVWLDADDMMLRVFAGVNVNPKAMRIAPADAYTGAADMQPEKIQEMDAFLWKVAIWSSKGRYPQTIDIDAPVFLRRWPNFTRYLMTPHAMRISALLISRGPQTLLNIAKLLNVELRYVYVFISAAYALGLAGQTQRQSDLLVRPELLLNPPEKKSLFKKFISKLGG